MYILLSPLYHMIPSVPQEDDSYFNAARITSILALDHSVWVGTGEGTLITYDVFTQGHKTPSDCSDYLTDTALLPIALPPPPKGTELKRDHASSGDWPSSEPKSESESYMRLLEVEKRVRDLYAQGIAAEPSEDEDGDDAESCGQNKAGNSASGYYSNSSNACNDSAAGKVSSKVCNDGLVVETENGGGGCNTNNVVSSGYPKPISHQESADVTSGDGTVNNKGSPRHASSVGGVGSSHEVGNGVFEGSDSIMFNRDPQNTNLSMSNNGKKDCTCTVSTTDKTSSGICLMPLSAHIPQTQTLNKAKPTLSKSDSMDSRRTSVVSGSTEASAASLPWDSGYVHTTTSCRSSESSAAAVGEMPGLEEIPDGATEVQNGQFFSPSHSFSGASSKSATSGEEVNGVQALESKGGTNGSVKSRKKLMNRKNARRNVDASPPPHPDVYYLFRPDLSSEKKTKSESVSRHCDGFDENKNRRCFCGTAGQDPLASHLNSPISKALAHKEKNIEGCANVCFQFQSDKDIPSKGGEGSEPVQANSEQNYTATNTKGSIANTELGEDNIPPAPPNSHHTSTRSASLDSNKTTGSDDVFQYNGEIEDSLETSRSSLLDTLNSDTTEIVRLNSIEETLNDDHESQSKNPTLETKKMDSLMAQNTDDRNIAKESVQMNSKLELIQSNLDSSVMKSETKTLANKTLPFGPEQEGSAVKINVDKVVEKCLLDAETRTDDSKVRDQSNSSQKPLSAFTTVKSLTAKFEAAQGKRSPSRIFEPREAKSCLRRTASLGVARPAPGNARVTSGRSGRLLHLSVDSWSDSDEEACDRQDGREREPPSPSLNHCQNSCFESIGTVTEEMKSADQSSLKQVSKNKVVNEEDKGDDNLETSTQTLDFDSPVTKTIMNSKEMNCFGQVAKDDAIVKGEDATNVKKPQVNGLSHDTSNPPNTFLAVQTKQNNDKQLHPTANNINNNHNFISAKGHKTIPSLAADIINQKNNINNMNSFNLSKTSESQTQPTAVQPKLPNPSVAAAKIDTKFYGDSDEDTCVHEARVQSFKDTYKRFSANSVKTKPQAQDGDATAFNENLSPGNVTPLNKSSVSSGKKDRNMKLSFRNGASSSRISDNLSPNSIRLDQFEASSDSQSSPVTSPQQAPTRLIKPVATRKATAISAAVDDKTNLSSPPATISTTISSSNVNSSSCSSTKSRVIISGNTSAASSDSNSMGQHPTAPIAIPPAATQSGLPSASSTSSFSTMSSPGGDRRPSSLGRRSSDISSIHGNFRSRDVGARWRLDYTNIHVDTTDLESLAMSSVSRDGAAEQEEGDETRDNGDTRRLSCLSTGSDMKKIRLSQFLEDTAESFTSQFRYAAEEEVVGVCLIIVEVKPPREKREGPFLHK